ncbi:hypothetical protein [Granulicella sp. dw_53]|uniref:hypothetical protein n=1 Tax=Granulicella sp. dw_53 TaxID=2719792 RepID=UPI002106FA4F|nr:hypothetical protein [Granulicella sp. dw_53]
MQQSKPVVTNAPATKPQPTRALHLWHLLSLDAPTVATLWAWFVARAASVHLPPYVLVSMFLAVWMLYAADRLLDARQLFANPLHTDELEPRHLFHHRHAPAFLTGILFASITLAALLPLLIPRALELYSILGALLFAWFLLIHARATPSSASNRRLPKELAVGIFFPAAIFIPTVARQPGLQLALLPHAILFAAACSINCLAIYAWEHPAPRLAAHWTTRLGTAHLSALASTATAISLILALLTRSSTLWPLALAACLSSLTLLILHLQHQRLNPITLRAAADLALLTPILLLPWMSK